MPSRVAFFFLYGREICYGIIKVNSTPNRCLACVDLGRVISTSRNDDGDTTAMVGRVYWLTGLSGAGKTTVATILRDRLLENGFRVVFLDGDRLRAVLAPDAGHTPHERRQLAHVYGRLCRELADQDLLVICATISMFHAVRDWNRANISGYCEIYLHVPVDQRRARDPKALYRNQIADMVGEDDTFEAPKSPDLVIENYGSLTPTLAAASIWDNLIATDSMLFKEPQYHDKSKPAAR